MPVVALPFAFSRCPVPLKLLNIGLSFSLLRLFQTKAVKKDAGRCSLFVLFTPMLPTVAKAFLGHGIVQRTLIERVIVSTATSGDNIRYYATGRAGGFSTNKDDSQPVAPTSALQSPLQGVTRPATSSVHQQKDIFTDDSASSAQVSEQVQDPEASQPLDRRLILKNLPWTTSETKLFEMLRDKHQAQWLRLFMDKRTGRFRGVAAVGFSSSGDAKTAISALNKEMFGGRPVVATWPLARPSKTTLLKHMPLPARSPYDTYNPSSTRKPR